MKRLILAAAVAPCPVWAEPPWLTITGSPVDEAADTIQVNPIALRSDGAKRTMEVRVSRGHDRVSTDAVRFRSFIAKVEFDCSAMTARFVESQFYAAPLWNQPTQRITYPASKIRTMEFRGFEPNPRDRVIRAACRSPTVK